MARALAAAPLRAIGLISYSLYLWHWPVFALACAGLLLPRTPTVMAVLVAVTTGLSILTWRFV